jgi:NAD(P)-dependent dehydrogenase (short-subunit alcohol dehydrogenase family)
MLTRGLLTAGRVVVLTGDIYIRSNECTRDFTYEGRSGGSMAYCRSKLGNIWFTRELQKRHPELEVVTVHPGVVATGLGGQAPLTGFRAKMRDRFILTPEAGAQTPLFCATQPNLERGGYYHNTLGRLTLRPNDPAANEDKALALWDQMETLAKDFR